MSDRSRSGVRILPATASVAQRTRSTTVRRLAARWRNSRPVCRFGKRPFFSKPPVHKLPGGHDCNTLINGYGEQLLVTTDDHPDLRFQGAGEKFIVFRIFTYGIWQRTARDDLGVPYNKLYERLNIGAGVALRQSFTDPDILVNDFRRHHQVHLASTPHLEDSTGGAAKKYGRHEDIGVNDNPHR